MQSDAGLVWVTWRPASENAVPDAAAPMLECKEERNHDGIGGQVSAEFLVYAREIARLHLLADVPKL